MEARQWTADLDTDRELESVIVRIRALGPGPMEPPPGPEAIAAIVAQAGAETPMTPEELVEWQRQWESVLEACTRA